MTTASQIMHEGVECVATDDTLQTAAVRMRDLHVGALPVCGDDDRLRGIVTDRDIVVHCLADGKDPRDIRARELAAGAPVWVDADADVDQVLSLMESHAIRRLPVIRDHRLVGMISEADLATHLSEHQVAEFTHEVYAAPPND
ncbi:CBS domain-containing protein [Asanoa iriomotensis]|uniref:Hypoxic response protein 1 n=1 Tax=Asanoa iriomotensis TaxID=234613 RepID=A0ABQ4CDX6_9ACTN|nr:CBS domain-containing protein [Asanoa iriomotensis]GIF60965.1 hypoxic response protein 1 [Asanoa iriomotensis]